MKEQSKQPFQFNFNNFPIIHVYSLLIFWGGPLPIFGNDYVVFLREFDSGVCTFTSLEKC